MPTIVVRTPPPVEAAVSDGPFAETALDTEALVTLREALLIDACRAVQASGSDLLVTVAPIDSDADRAADRALDAVEATLDRDLETTPRIEPQVGSTPAARLGNTVTHLIEAGASSVGVVFSGAIVDRATLDQATIQLRTADVVLGPAPGGRVAYAGFTAPIDFADALASPAIRTLAERAVAADHDATTIDLIARASDPASLDGVTALIEARRLVGDRVPETLAAWIETVDEVR
ncbi:hypothetical protein [Halococcoides cellulosivorans]|uniref:DUF2064 domain-containing protein n=1 Tax=Halococcoides cellulosivorans TaxID=1679096 RepID=A0A2R4X2I6_9EURY|nr:hypothetical protein [Halococcoides cellulosivorans]AWB27933.1 hypothetical protein HARCEL1_09525 [Halococcoides cellulosivorans]